MSEPTTDKDGWIGTHTSGPWTHGTPWNGFSEIRGPNNELVFGLAVGTAEEKQADNICQANAHLIAAAPELLEACQELLERFSKTTHTLLQVSAMNKARAAIAKATEKGTS